MSTKWNGENEHEASLHLSSVNKVKTPFLMVFRRLLWLCFLHLDVCPTEVCVKHCGTRGGVSDSVWEDVWRFREDLRKWQPTPVLLPGKSHGWRSLVGYSPWGHKESDTTEWRHINEILSFLIGSKVFYALPLVCFIILCLYIYHYWSNLYFQMVCIAVYYVFLSI